MDLKFVTYTVGLTCHGYGQFAKLVKVEISETDEGYCLQPVSGLTLERQAGRTYISGIDYRSIPRDAFDKGGFAIALLEKCGWQVAGLEDSYGS